MEQYKVKRDKNSHIALELRRSEKYVTAIIPDGCTRRVEKIKPVDFDKRWKDHDYRPARLAEKMLIQKFIRLSEQARKELIMIIVLDIHKAQVLGIFEEEAVANAASPADAVKVSGPEDLASFTEKEMVSLYNSYVPEDKQITGRIKGGKPLFSKELFEVLKSAKVAAAQLKTPKSGDGPVAKAHQIFAANAALPVEERKSRKDIIAACVEAGINKATATTQYGKFHSEQGGSTMERNGSIAKVRAIIEEHYGTKTRKEIIALCEAAGLNKATASTQYGKYNQEAQSQIPEDERKRLADQKAAEKAEAEAKKAEEKAAKEAEKAEKKAAKEAEKAAKKAEKEAAAAAAAGTPAE